MTLMHVTIVTTGRRLRDAGRKRWWVRCAFCSLLYGPYATADVAKATNDGLWEFRTSCPGSPVRSG